MERGWARVAIALLALMWVTVSIAQVHVRGHYRKNGTYVAPHYRSSPNSTRLDNWSTKGNVNPYTGEPGTRNPYPTTYTSPTYYPRTYSPPPYQPRTYYPRTYVAPTRIAPRYSTGGTYVSYSAGGQAWTPPRAAYQASQPQPQTIPWYRCDDPDGSNHYSHHPGGGCVYVGSGVSQ